MRTRFLAACALAALMLGPLLTPPTGAQTRITAPREALGFNFGDDYHLANYQQIEAYWRTLERESDRLILHDMGRTTEGRTQLMAVVTSPENHRNLERYREIARRLALAEGLTDEEARELAREGKAVVWIDGGLHASETLGAQQLAEMVYQLVSLSDAETLRFLDDCIILLVHANPDGNDLVADWYMREPIPERRRTGDLPRLYQKYIGHDNNRDFFSSTQTESRNINRALYHDWFPQILYNHHQSSPRGTVVWSSPQRDPWNYNLDPLIILGSQSLGLALHTRLAAEGKPGATKAAGGPYDGWWNGGIRNTACFHNVIAILTETHGSPNPTRIPLVMSRQLPDGNLAFPIEPQTWRFRQSVDYSLSFNRAVIDYAARNRENLLYNIYVMGRNSIERGSRDHWTPNPRRYAEAAERLGGAAGNEQRDMAVWAELRQPEYRDPRGFIIPADQPDFPTATKFVNALLRTGVAVHRATEEFEVLGKRYPAGSYVVLAAQAYRPHVIDMFEPQVHPDVVPYPGAPPTPPYDHAGWTFAFQMGIEFDRILEGFEGPFEQIGPWEVEPPPGRVSSVDRPAGFLTDRRVNDAVIAVNRLLAANEAAYWLRSPLRSGGRTYPAGTLYLAASETTPAALERLAEELGVDFEATTAAPPDDALRLREARIGLWDRYGGSMDSGWARWLLEQFEFPFEVVFPPQLDEGRLREKYDVLIFVGGAIPASDEEAAAANGEEPAQDLPPELQALRGSVTVRRTVPMLRTFVEEGGTLIAIGSSANNLVRHFELPVENHLTEEGRPLPRSRYFVPGSILMARVDTEHPLAHGMREDTHVFFDRSPVFRLRPAAENVRRVAWFDTDEPLRSGWAWGQEHLEDGTLALEARLGAGRALLFGPDILKRAQPHGTFKFLFNGIYLSAGD